MTGEIAESSSYGHAQGALKALRVGYAALCIAGLYTPVQAAQMAHTTAHCIEIEIAKLEACGRGDSIRLMLEAADGDAVGDAA